LNEAKRQSGDFDDLRKPGWLPTSIVVNILRSGDKREGFALGAADAITITESPQGNIDVSLPGTFTGSDWSPETIHPIEVIDGQHRLWAFEHDGIGQEFELPIVAFQGLDISWQAYLFWTINIRPKRINASLAFDLYPLLRTEDWLEKFEGHSIYRETRAQELTEALWAIPESPWHGRINMLGEPGLQRPMVSQAAWIRSLLATYVKSWEGKRTQIGGLFGAGLIDQHEEVLPWSRAQQAAFLIYVGQRLRDAIRNSKERWTTSLRKGQTKIFSGPEDEAFYGPHTLLTTDQGIRGLLYVTNDACYVRAKELRLSAWTDGGGAEASDEKAVHQALDSLSDQPVARFIQGIAKSLSKYDWRTSSAPELSENERIRKAGFRGSGGYRELRQELLRQLADDSKEVGAAARDVLSILNY
jgi:hypothetical protein